MILYKYRQDSEWTESIFIKKEVWLSTPEKLNDPFECSYNISLNGFEKQAEQAAMMQFLGAFLTIPSQATNKMQVKNKKRSTASDDQKLDLKNKYSTFLKLGFTIEEVEELLRKMNSPYLTKKGKYMLFYTMMKENGYTLSNPYNFLDICKKQLQSIGIFSLSEDPVNQLMWAHYGDQSRGIAIGFNKIASSKLSDLRHCFKVNYTDDLTHLFDDDGAVATLSMKVTGYGPRPNTLSFENEQKMSFYDHKFQKIISTKPEAWQYEHEWRYIEEYSGSYSLPAPVSEIVFGLRCPDETIKKYVEFTNTYLQNPVAFSRIIKSENTMKLVKVPLN